MVTLESGAVSMLQECCLHMASALILNPESGLVWQARFESASRESITLHLLEEVEHSFETSNLFVSFSHNGNSCAFFGRIMEYHSNTAQVSSYLVLRLLGNIIGMERRMSHRVAIGETVVPVVRVSTAENRILFPKPKDLSLAGIMVEFDESEDPNLLPAAELGLALRLDEHAVCLKSVVRHRDDHRYSLHFPEVFTANGISALRTLRKIVETLERALLQERSRINKSA